jgi:hypothetical protein
MAETLFCGSGSRGAPRNGERRADYPAPNERRTEKKKAVQKKALIARKFPFGGAIGPEPLWPILVKEAVAFRRLGRQ